MRVGRINDPTLFIQFSLLISQLNYKYVDDDILNEQYSDIYYKVQFVVHFSPFWPKQFRVLRVFD